MENPKIKASLKDKIKFLVITYGVTIVLWLVAAYLSVSFTPILQKSDFFVTISNFDTFKIVAIFLAFAFIGFWYLDKQSSSLNGPILMLRFVMVAIIIVGINIRWNIDPYNSAYFTYIYNIAFLTIVGQVLRTIFLVIQDKGSNNLKDTFDKVTSRIIFTILIGLIFYLVFTIEERSSKNPTIITIDQLLIDYLKYPLLILIFMADAAFSKGSAFSRRNPYNLNHVAISEPLKAASLRLRFSLLIYFFVAGLILTEEVLTNTL
ncbi:MAG: hypothetical protein ACFB0B_06275 [Thermonemataceae bacterium]